MLNPNHQPNTTSAAGKRPAAPKMQSTQSMNELLNFSLPPRQQQPIPRRSRKYGAQHGIWNKERESPGFPQLACLSLACFVPGFVNAQYRFVMIPNGDYTVHFADPDMYVYMDSPGILDMPDCYLATSSGKTSSRFSSHVLLH